MQDWRAHLRPSRVAAVCASAVMLLGTGTMRAATPECPRECLEGILDSYLDALAVGQPARAPISDRARITENGRVVPAGQGSWQTVTGIGAYRVRALDPLMAQAVFLGVLQEGLKSTMFAVRLRIARREITDIETIIARVGLPGDAGNAAAHMVSARPAFATVVSANHRSSRAAMIKAASSYYRGIERGSGRGVAFAEDCHRIENGVALVNNPSFRFDLVARNGRTLPNFAAMGCKEQFDTGLWGSDRVLALRFAVVDEEHGIVAAYSIYRPNAKKPCAIVRGYGEVCPSAPLPSIALDLVELFRITDGRIHEMESVWTVLPPGGSSGW